MQLDSESPAPGSSSSCESALLFLTRFRQAAKALGLCLLTLVVSAAANAQVSLSPSQIDFGGLYIGSTSTPRAVTLTNSGSSVVYLSGASFSGTFVADFFVLPSNCPFFNAALLQIGPGSTCSFSFEFVPSTVATETVSGSFALIDSSFQPLGSVGFALSGTGKFPLTFVPAQLNFGNAIENLNTGIVLPLTLTNNSSTPLVFFASASSADFGVDVSPCPYSFLAAGASCSVNVSFAPTITGQESGLLQLRAVNAETDAPLGGTTVPLTGFGHPIGVSFAPFGLQLVGGTYQTPAGLFNSSFMPVNISAVTLSGAGFSKDNGCIGTLAPRTFCTINITFAPASNVAYSGTLTIVDGDPTSPQTVAITGTGTALKVNSLGIDFGEQHLLTSSASQSVMLSNVSQSPVAFQAVVDDVAYLVANNCKSRVPAGGSCTVSVRYRPAVNGINPGKLTITPADPIGPQRFFLRGKGVGIGNMKVRLHYDYMVAADHTHDPEVTSPGAIQRVVDAFARQGVELIIDPHHTAIPEIENLTFDPSHPCPNTQGSFLGLRDQYFVPTFPDQHYTMFAHKVTDPEIFCLTGGASGQAELPGLSFVVALGLEQADGFPADVFSMMVSGTTMHELGHNLGLHHGGHSDINYKPNYFSIMSYAHQFSGMVQAVQVGSSAVAVCSKDTDCVSGQSCVFHSCRRLDYSSQVLPVGGNTPGLLDESDLDETAGLGSGTADLGSFSTCLSFVNFFASNGPVDWNGDGAANNRHLSFLIDLQGEQFDLHTDCPGTRPLLRLEGFNDWAYLLGTDGGSNDSSPMNFVQDNQGATDATRPPAASTSRPRSVPEISLDEARLHHVLLAPRPASLLIQSGCMAGTTNGNATDRTVTIAVLGSPDFDVTQIELSSLRFHRAQPLNTAFLDVNGDGLPDLVIKLRDFEIVLAREATTARLTGWLKNSQIFVAETELGTSAPKLASTCTW